MSASDKIVTETVEKAVKATPVVITTITETVPDFSAEIAEVVSSNPFRTRGLIVAGATALVLGGAVGYVVWKKRKQAAEKLEEEIVEVVSTHQSANPTVGKQKASA
jgi:hypothetical protein